MPDERRAPDRGGDTPALPARVLTWSNLLSLARIPLAVAFPLVESSFGRAVLALAAALTDFVDGFLARRFGQGSRVGELLDPIADKLFIVVALATFFLEGTLAWWQLLALLGRDIFVVAGFLIALALGLRIRFRARSAGKLVTVLQLSAVLLLVVRPDWIHPLVLLAVPISGYAVIDYARAALAGLHPRADAG